MNLTDLEESMIDDRFKGVPPGTEPFRLGEIGHFGWNVLAEDLPLPTLQALSTRSGGEVVQDDF